MILKKLSAWIVSLALVSAAAQLPASVPAYAAAGAAHEYSTDVQDDIFQYHFAGGTDAFMNGVSNEGRAYDAYLWVPQTVSPGELKGLVAVKANLIEVPFVESAKLRAALAEKGFGILWLVFAKDAYGYNNTFSNFNTRTDYKGGILYSDASDFTNDGKDAADIMNDILKGIAASSGYAEIADKTPLITVGHSAASPFGYRSGNWDPDRIIAQIQMKNGMGAPLYQSNKGMVPGIPSLQYAAQYTEHALGADRDRSVRDARWHITNQRAQNTDMLVSHIIEWGSGHYDWSDNATDMMIKYIDKAIEYRLPDDYAETGRLSDLTGSGYLMKPFEKDENGGERGAGYYREHGWLSDGMDNEAASEADKKASFWFFDKEFAEAAESFTEYAVPEAPDSVGTGIAGKTYSSIEPFMLMKDPSKSTHADAPYTAPEIISPYLTFNSGMSRYGNTRFVDYEKLGNPGGNSDNSANLQGYDTVTVDTYYMSRIPSIVSGEKQAYDGAGDEAYVPRNTKAEFVPLMAPYEIVSSETVPIDGMTRAEDNAEAVNAASVTRTTLRFSNNRVYYRAGCGKTNEYGTQLDSFGMILSPEIIENGEAVSAFKATGVQMNVPYTGKGSQTLTLDPIANVNINDPNAGTSFDVSYTSSDSDLQKYTDVFVEYGPARAVRAVDPSDGSYSWKIEILEDEIPDNASYPIEVNVVASNLGKWETVAAASAEQKFYITDKDTPSGVYLDGEMQNSFDEAVDGAHGEGAHTVAVYSGSTAQKRHDLSASENISFMNGDFRAEVKKTGSGMMFLNKDTSIAPQLTFGKSSLLSTDRSTALEFNMDGKGRFAEINKGILDLYNGVVITGGSAERGGGIDCKTGSVLNIHGGIITGNTAVNSQYLLGGGGVSVVGSGKASMDGGVISGNISEDRRGGGLSVMENGSFDMSGGSITGNTGYDVYVNNNNMTMSGSAEIGSLYIADGKTVTVNGAFTSGGSHAEITPGIYSEGAELVRYAEGLAPSPADFTVADENGTEWYLYADGQSLKLTKNAPYAITAMNGIAVKGEAYAGETVTLTVPDGYVENSFVVSKISPSQFTRISENQYSFTMPENGVTVSCLVNTDSRKVIVVGVHDTYFVRNDNDMNVEFDVPSPGSGYTYLNADVYIPARTSGQDENMAAVMNDISFTVSGGNISGSGDVKTGKNIMRITYTGSVGVDYYSYIGGWNGSGYDYPRTAGDLSTLTLTRAVYAHAEMIKADGVEDAAANNDAVGYYVENMSIPSWNPALKWQLMFSDGKKAEKSVDIPGLSGEGSVSFGIVLYGEKDGYGTSDIENVYVVE